MFKSRSGLSILEVIIVVALVVVIATLAYVSTRPTKRLGEAADVQRQYDVESIEKAIKLVATDSGSLSSALTGLDDNTPYMIVKAGGSTVGTYSCTATGTSIAKADISGAISSIMPNLPVDPDLADTSNETGYYLIKNGNSYNIETCDSYYLAATVGNKQSCGDGYCGSTESCSTCTIDCGACAVPVCGNGIPESGEECDDGNVINTDDCTTACLNPVCGDTYTWAGHEVCDDGDTFTEGCGNGVVEEAGTYCSADCSTSMVLAKENCDYLPSACNGRPGDPHNTSFGCTLKNPLCADNCSGCSSSCPVGP